MHKLLAPLAACVMMMGFSAAAGAAPIPLNDFVVNEGSVPGASANTFTADKLTGSYAERLTLNEDGTFDTAAYVNFAGFVKNDGLTNVPSQLNALNGYNMYALFTSSGTFSGGTFTGTTGSFSLYIDPDQDTTFAVGASGAIPVATGNDSDDYVIAISDSLLSAVGIVGNPGAYDLLFGAFTLTAEGANYFTLPRPFYLITNVDGDFDNFIPAVGTPIDVVGDVSAIFLIPEPGSLALAGLALAGLGLSTRRRKTA